MAKLHWIIPCLVATIDRQTNLASLTHILEEIAVPADAGPVEAGKIMLIQPGFAVVSLWSRTTDKPEKVDARLTLTGPNKKRLAGADFAVDLTSSQRYRNVSRFAHFPYVGPGGYLFQVHLRSGAKWRRVGDTAVVVRLAESGAQADGKGTSENRSA